MTTATLEKSGPLKGTHFLFYVLELLFGSRSDIFSAEGMGSIGWRGHVHFPLVIIGCTALAHGGTRLIALSAEESLPQKYLAKDSANWRYFNTLIAALGRAAMANVLPKEKQAAETGALVGRFSTRAIQRMTGIHRDTIMRLGVRVGQGRVGPGPGFQSGGCSGIQSR